MSDNNDKILVAKETFTVNLDGTAVTIHKGQTRVREGHPLLKGREMYFEPLTVQYDLEQATAKPGEKRGEADSGAGTAGGSTTASSATRRGAPPKEG